MFIYILFIIIIGGILALFTYITRPVAYPGIFSGGGSTNSVEDIGQREGDLGAVAP